MKAAIVGCGAIASRWLRAFAADGRVAPAVLVDPDHQAAARLARKHSLDIPVVPAFVDALAGHAIDVVVNLTPPERHAEVSAGALDAGVHVLSEKPLATSLDDAIGLVDLATRRRRLLCVMQNRGADARFVAFTDRVRNDTCGSLLVTADVLVDLPVPGFRSRQRLVATLDLAVHAFDQIRRIIPACPLIVDAREAPLSFLGAHCALTVITVAFADGSIFSYRGGYTAGPGERVSANGSWTIRGRNALATWNGDRTAVVTTTDKPTPEHLTLPDFAPSYLTSITEMIEAVAGATNPPGPAVGNLGSIALLDAALTSAATGRPTVVRELPRLLQEF